MSEERAPTKNSQIFIARLHPSVNEKDLKYKFQKFGEIKDVRLKPGYAFIVNIKI
jgi:RNA recognition motif-containing protein